MLAAWVTQIFLIPALFNFGVRGRDRRGLLALAVTAVLLAGVALVFAGVAVLSLRRESAAR
ncbi:hypothetical protein [Nocardiopsis nanhaiensis]